MLLLLLFELLLLFLGNSEEVFAILIEFTISFILLFEEFLYFLVIFTTKIIPLYSTKYIVLSSQLFRE